MDIRPEHVQSKKQVGTLKGKPVFQVRTTGGLVLVVASGSGGTNVLGVGPHQGVARYIAEKKEADLKWTDLSKADYVPYEAFAFILPKYEALTEEFRST